MKLDIYSYIKHNFSQQPFEIDRVLVTSFIVLKNLSIKNNLFLKAYVIQEKNVLEYRKVQEIVKLLKDHTIELTIEKLIELFEFVLSPADRVINGAIYTPLYIREYIVNSAIGPDAINYLIGDISCGCGGFLITAAKRLKSISENSYCDIIENNLFGLDIADYSVNRTKIILSLLALENGEDKTIKFNINIGNALNFQWREINSVIKKNKGFDLIIGNPPYVCSRNIDENSKLLLENWQVTKSGHPDLYIPFFEVGLFNLRLNGMLSYITLNTFFKSLNGRALRDFFSKERLKIRIIDFRGEQVFKNKNTYTCICFIEKTERQFIEYYTSGSQLLNKVCDADFSKIQYSELDNKHGWNFAQRSVLETINKIEGFEDKLFPKFSFSTGIATLKNEIYKFKPSRQDKEYYHFEQEGKAVKIERAICREIINANKVTTDDEINSLKEKIIFPYSLVNGKYEIISEKDFRTKFPYAYSFLAKSKNILKTRDKGIPKVDVWYAYGRSQGLNVPGIKLFLPHISNSPSFVLSKDKKLLFCNGEAIVSNNEFELVVIKKILESKVFWFYIYSTSKPYSSGYFSLSKNYLKKFSIPPLSDEDKAFLYETEDETSLSKFILAKYGIKKSEILIVQTSVN